MTESTPARDLIRRYVRLLADWWTPQSETDRRVEEVYMAVRTEALTEAAARVRALPTANDGQLIAAYRDVVLNTITTTEA